MHKRFLILANLAFGCVALLATAAQAKEPDDADMTAALDEEMLRKEGLSTETKDLVAWLKQRSENDEDLGRIDKLIEQLGYTDRKEREAAQHKLAMLGLNGWTEIIKAAKRTDNPIAGAAKACMEEIEKEHHAFLNLATVRLLVYRKAPVAVESLLRYLPFTVDENVEEEIYYGLDALAISDKKLHQALVAALKDPMPARRAVAGCIVARMGDEEQKAGVRKLVDDKDAYVRLRAAQGLLAGKDKTAVPTLIKLLTDPSPSIAWQAEELLQYIAGTSAPKLSVGKEVGEKAEKCRTAWAEWWKKHEDKCDLDEAQRNGRRPGLVLFSTCGNEFQSEGSLWICGCNSTPRLLLKSLQYPWHVEWLRADRLLLADFDTISTRPVAGEVNCEIKVPICELYVKMDRANPVCQHRYPFRVYYCLQRYLQVDNTTEVPEDKKPIADVWEYGIDGYKKPLPVDPNGRQRMMPTTGKRLENGNWLWLDATRNKNFIVEVDGRSGKLGSSPSPEKLSYSGHITLCPLASGDYLLGQEADGEIKQITRMRAGEKVWSYGTPRSVAPQRLFGRLRDGNTRLQLQNVRLVEVSVDGRQEWDVFSEHDGLLTSTSCLALVHFGFPSRPKDWDVEKLDACLQGLKADSLARRKHCLELLPSFGEKALQALPDVLDSISMADGELWSAAQPFLHQHRKDTIPRLIPWIDAADPVKRRVAINVLCTLPDPPKEALPKILGRLRDDDKRVQGAAVGALGWFRSEPAAAKVAVDALVAFIKDRSNDKVMRHGAIGTLRGFGSQGRPAVPLLLEVMREKDADERMNAATTLGFVATADKDVVAGLTQALGDEDINVVTCAASAIAQLGLGANAAVPALIKACEFAEKPNVKANDVDCLLVAVVRALGQMKEKAEPAVPTLIRIALDSRFHYRQNAIEAIGAVGPAAKSHSVALRKAIATLDDEKLRKQLRDLVDALP